MTFDRDCYENEDFREISCAGQELSRMKFIRCRFDSGDFSDTVFDHCTFESCTFVNTRLGGARFSHCGVLNGVFRYARLFSSEFIQCKMTGSTLTDADCACLVIDGGDWSFAGAGILQDGFFRRSLCPRRSAPVPV